MIVLSGKTHYISLVWRESTLRGKFTLHFCLILPISGCFLLLITLSFSKGCTIDIDSRNFKNISISQKVILPAKVPLDVIRQWMV